MNHPTPTGAAELPKFTAADGSTEVIHVPGYPLMVRAVDFNRLRAKVEELSAAQAELAAMRAGAAPVTQDDDPTTKAQYRRMFASACEALGAISKELGLDPDDGGADPILEAIHELRSGSAQPAAQDAERLDHLQKTGSTLELIPGAPNFYPMLFRVGGLHKSSNADVRLAIDAAIAAQQGDSHE